MAVCPICERSFDERAYQLVIRDIGAFDSVSCAEEAIRRHRRRTSGDLAIELLDAVREETPSQRAEDQARRLRG
jgi:hypothetical protein